MHATGVDMWSIKTRKNSLFSGLYHGKLGVLCFENISTIIILYFVRKCTDLWCSSFPHKGYFMSEMRFLKYILHNSIL